MTTLPAGHRAGKTLPAVARSVRREDLGNGWSRYRVEISVGGDYYYCTISTQGTGFFAIKHVLGTQTAGGNPASGARRALVEQAAREAVLA